MRSLQLLLAAVLAASSNGFFLPGMAPTATRRTAGSVSLPQVRGICVVRAGVAVDGRLAEYPIRCARVVWAARISSLIRSLGGLGHAPAPRIG